jgi:hypothetical protein
MAEIGDHVEIASTKVGQPARSGVVTAVTSQMLSVRWASGQESTLVPASGSVIVVGHEGKQPAGRLKAVVTKRTAQKTSAAKAPVRAKRATNGKAKAKKATKTVTAHKPAETRASATTSASKKRAR